MSASLCTFSIGEDTGGSVRMPAGFTNVTGIKPTYGRVSSLRSYRACIVFRLHWPMTRDAYDCATVLEHIAGHDPHDSTTYNSPVPNYTANINKPVKGMKLGIPKEYFVAGMEAGVESAMQEAICTYENRHGDSRSLAPPHQIRLARLLSSAFAEASANLARMDGTRFGLSVSTARRMSSTSISRLATKVSAMKSSAASCLARTLSLPDITTRIT
ncbi:MAG: hypothetical protein IPG80_18520 [Anaerolineales bacterium]|nr:hypothetical protein [Anaerolineales bacterium]